MTVIKLDAATLAKVRAGDTPLFLGDEAGRPVVQIAVTANMLQIGEPDMTEEEWKEIEDDPAEFPLSEAWEKIRRGEKF
jgi:hypothetical protein